MTPNEKVTEMQTTSEERNRYLRSGDCKDDNENDLICRLIDDVDFLRTQLEQVNGVLECGHSSRFVGAFNGKDGVCLACALEKIEKDAREFCRSLKELEEKK